MREYKLFIGGKWVEGHSGQWIEVENPATGEIFAKVPAGDETDVNRAVSAAQAALKVWRGYSAEERAILLEKVADYLDDHLDEIAEMVTKELGAPVSMAKDWHCSPAPDEARYFAQMARTFEYDSAVPGAIIAREPVGIVAGMTPWNYPLDQITIKIFPALAAGNVVILKPSQYTPLVSYFVAKAIEHAGFPCGVFNLITGRGGEVGNVLAAHPDIQMISFTGSTKAGREVGCLALNNIKKITLELGGKSPAVLLCDGDLATAVNVTLTDCFMNTGQTCSALTRLLVPRGRLAEVEAEIIRRSQDFKVGDPTDPETAVGPLIHKNAFRKVKRYIELGLAEGAKIIVGQVPEERERGYYVSPVVFSEVDSSMRIAQEEIFGPVLCLLPYDAEEEALAIANDSPYGLSGAVFGEEKHAIAFARKIESGGVRINEGALTLGAPFGGYKQSGIGREYCQTQFEEYLEIKSILI